MKNNKKRKGFIKPDSKVASLILDMGSALEGVNFGLSRPGLVVKFGMDGAKGYLERKDEIYRRQILSRLKEKSVIREYKIAGEIYRSFTKKGYEEYLKLKSIHAVDLPENQMCIISFDVPETQRRLRRDTRELLRLLGFKQLHRSVWATRKNLCKCITELFLLKKNNCNWFKVFVATGI